MIIYKIREPFNAIYALYSTIEKILIQISKLGYGKEIYMKKIIVFFRDNSGWLVGGILTIIQIIDIFEKKIVDVCVERYPFIATSILIVLLLIYLFGLVLKIEHHLRKSYEILTEKNNKIILVKGSIEKYFSKKEHAFVFSSSNFFNTNEQLIKGEVFEKYIEYCYESPASINEELQSSLNRLTINSEEITDETVTVGGNKKSYPMGTIAFADKYNLYLLAITSIKKDTLNSYSAISKPYYLDLALNNLWKKLVEQERQTIVCMPALGSGKSKTFSRQSSAIKHICESFIKYQKQNDVKICDKLIIVSGGANNKEVNLEQIKDYLSV